MEIPDRRDQLFGCQPVPKLNGFEVLELIGDDVAVIFATAYDDYALKAFEVHAVDYLLKPFSRRRLEQALARVEKQIGGGRDPSISNLVEERRANRTPSERILVRDGFHVHVIAVRKIDYVEAQDDYVSFKTSERSYLKQETMNEIEAQLDPRLFVRIHRSYILNLDRLTRIELQSKDNRVAALAEVCRAEGVIVIADEIYAQTTFDMDSFTSMARVYPEGTLLTGGLSKDRSCGGYRFGLVIVPEQASNLTENILKVAGSTYSCVAASFQYAAMEAYSGNDQLESHIRDCTKIHALAGRKTSALLSRILGVRTTTPRGAFYLLGDFDEHKVQFRELGLNTCVEFCENCSAWNTRRCCPEVRCFCPRTIFPSGVLTWITTATRLYAGGGRIRPLRERPKMHSLNTTFR